jgi:hypothetical protein
MKVKKEYTILFVIIVGLLLYLILRNPDRVQYQLPKLPHVPGTEVSKLEISKPETPILLVKRDNRWHITPQGYPANSAKIKDMLAIIESLTLTALVSESKNYRRYDLDKDKKITVKAWAGDTLRREFEVGKAASSNRHTFVRLPGDDRVYQARENFRATFNLTVKDLWEKTVLSFNPTEIHEIHVTKKQQSIHFTREQVPVEVDEAEKADDKSSPPPKAQTLWKSDDGEEGDGSKLNGLLMALSNLRCEKYIENRKRDDFTNPIYTLKLKGVEEYTLSIFDKMDEDAKSYPAISSQGDFPFLVSDRQMEKVMVDPEGMLKKPEKS